MVTNDGELDRAELFDFIDSHITSTRDEAMIVLKAHLVAESLLSRILEAHVDYPHALAQARLSFWQLVAVAEAHGVEPGRPWLWPALRALNSLRNQLAHKLESDHVDEKWHALVEATTPWIDVPQQAKSEARQRQLRLYILCAVLANVLHESCPGTPAALTSR